MASQGPGMVDSGESGAWEGRDVPVVSIIWGGLLIGLGLWGYLGTGTTSWTALIPAFVGAPLALCGLLALKESLLKHAMHAAAMIGLIGFLGGVGRIVSKPPTD